MTFKHIDIIIEELENNHHLLMASDGSGKTKAMTLGWVLSTLGGHWLAQTAGHCQGRESSLREAEATGMLPATMCMALVQQDRNKNIAPIAIQ